MEDSTILAIGTLVASIATLVAMIGQLILALKSSVVQHQIHEAVNSTHQAAIARIAKQDERIDELRGDVEKRERKIVDLTGESSDPRPTMPETIHKSPPPEAP